jgi:hypothetical protein
MKPFHRIIGVVGFIGVALPIQAQVAISRHPQNQAVIPGASARFQISVAGASQVTYQWQNAAPGSSNFVQIEGATSPSYTTSGVIPAASGSRYRCLVTDTKTTRTLYSEPASLTVVEPNGNVLPSPKLKLPPYASVAGDLAVDYPINATSIRFEWSLMESTPEGKSKNLSPTTARHADFQTTDRSASLSRFNLVPGVYLVTVWAFDDAANRSAPAVAKITLIGTDLSQIYVHSNPLHQSSERAAEFEFGGLPSNAEVKIFSPRGAWVKTLSPSSWSAKWDLTDTANQRVSPGKYLYFVKSSNGAETLKGELLVQN